MNEIATTYLEAYAQGAVVEGGWSWAKALQQARLDYSERSLARLDKLLTQIRERARPAPSELESVAGRNFVALVAFYVIELARRRTQATLDWYERGVALRVLPAGVEPPEGEDGRLVAWAPDQRAAFFPLAWVRAQVLGQGARRGPSDYVAGVVGHLERDGPPAWWAGMEALGRMASWQMMMAADGGRVLPTMLGADRPDTWVTLAGGLPGDDLLSAVMRGGQRLEGNPAGAAWQVLAYDGVVELAQGRCDAVVVILVTQGDVPLRLKMAFPYRPGNGGRRFAILDPVLRETNVDAARLEMLRPSMQRGIASVKWAFGITWEELRVSGDAAASGQAPEAPRVRSQGRAPGRGAARQNALAAGPQGEWRRKPAWKFW